MEDDKDKKMSDRDRKMSWSFESFSSKEKDDDKDKKKGKRTVKIPRKGIIAGSGETQEIKPDSEKKSIFSGLLGEKEVKVESVSEQTKEKAEPSKDDYQEVVFDRIKDVEQELELPLHEDDADVITTDAEFLEEVSERIEEGLPPETAIDDALETVYIPPEADATEADLDDRINYESPVESDETNEIPEIVTEVGAEAEDAITEVLGVDEPETIEVAPEPEIVPMNEIYYRERSSGNVIMGGAMGYLLRNRHGRGSEHQEVKKPSHDKQAEKQQERKLEEFRNKLESTEAVVREVAINQAAEKPRVEVKEEHVPSEKLAEGQLAKMKIETLMQEKKDIEMQEKQFEKVLDKEVEQARVTEKQEAHTDKVPEVFRDLLEKGRDIRSLTMPELLEVAEHIVFEKQTLKELYEHHRIDAINMRRVIIEYMNGGTRYERLLIRALEAVEMQRELRNEIKHEDDGFSAVDGQIGDNEKPSNSTENSEVVNQIRASLENNSTKGATNESESLEKYSVITKEWAITIGILTGIAIAVLVIVFG